MAKRWGLWRVNDGQAEKYVMALDAQSAIGLAELGGGEIHCVPIVAMDAIATRRSCRVGVVHGYGPGGGMSVDQFDANGELLAGDGSP